MSGESDAVAALAAEELEALQLLDSEYEERRASLRNSFEARRLALGSGSVLGTMVEITTFMQQRE